MGTIPTKLTSLEDINYSYFKISSSLTFFLFPLRALDLFILAFFILEVFLKWLLVADKCSLMLKNGANCSVWGREGHTVEHQTARARGQGPLQDEQAECGPVGVCRSSLQASTVP